MDLSAAHGLLTDFVRGQFASEQRRLDRIAYWMQTHRDRAGFRRPATMPKDAPETSLELARLSEANYLPLVLDTFSQVLKVDGYMAASSDVAASSWADWQRNRMDARQTGLTRAALQYGTAYALVSEDVAEGVTVPRISLFSPRRMVGLFDDADDEWPEFAVFRTRDRVTLVDDEAAYPFVLPNGAVFPAKTSALAALASQLIPAEPEPHGMGFVPVIRYRDRMLLDGEEQQGIIEPLIIIQERINDVTYKQQVSLHVEAFRQRYIIGWSAESEEEALKATAQKIWTFGDKDPSEVQVGSLDTGDPGNYSGPRAEAIRDMAAIGQIPAQSLGVDGISNISDATLAGLEAAKDRKVSEIKTSLGESHEQLMRTCGQVRGDAEAAADYESEVHWAEFQARSFAATVDGLVKLVQAQVIPTDMALEKVPGVTQQEVRRADRSLRKAQGTQLVQQLIASRQPAAAEVPGAGDAA